LHIDFPRTWSHYLADQPTMRFPLLFISSLVSLSTAFSLSGPSKHSRDTSCVNSPNNRKCWSEGFDITTNYYENVPDTGVTREYWFNIENTTAAPDGVEIPVQLINGSLPGPTIIADWGDEVGACIQKTFHHGQELC
jgi:hypothetical protein